MEYLLIPLILAIGIVFYLFNVNTQLKAQLVSEIEKAELHSTNFLEREKLLKDSSLTMSESFKALSSEALSGASSDFLSLAQETLSKWHEKSSGDLNSKYTEVASLVNPIKESLNKLDTKLETVEKERASSNSSLAEQLKGLNGVQDSLRKETSGLVRALRTPQVRGRWGELQLKKVLEISGMSDHYDFQEQVSVDTDDGRLRPDMIINLPGNKKVIIDSKVPLLGFLDSLEAVDDVERDQKLKDHARQLKSHINSLGLKSYWDQFPEAPEFVIMFVPGEAFLNAALDQDHELLEYALNKKVLLTTPTSLIGLLKAVAYGWQQDSFAKNSKAISDLGTELYERVRTFTNNFLEIKKGLDKTIEAYNKTVNSLETRVLVTARKFNSLGVTGTDSILEIEQVDKIAKLPNSSTE